jgi:dihydroorotase/N-acyl-D-amino-acid deacylase
MRYLARAVAGSLVAMSAVLLPWATTAQERYDLLLRNGLIVDGSGAAPFRGDVGIRGDQIARVAPAIDAAAGRVIDVGGEAIAPGFIDIHTHAIRGIFDVPTADNYIRQGVTSIMEGPDGSSAVPLGPFLQKLDALQKSINIGSFVGQGSIRAAVVGLDDRPATAAELERMRRLVEQAMRDGGFGLSSGLFYVPGSFTPIDEVVELARVAAKFGGMYVSHMRDETTFVVDAVGETIFIGERGGLPTQVTHHKIVGQRNFGRSVDTLRLIDEARARGVDATLDVYPYTASANDFHASMVPAWAQAGGRDRMLERLQDPATRARIKGETVRVLIEERGGGDLSRVQISRCRTLTGMAGKTLAEITRERGLTPTVENGAETALWLVAQDECGGIYHALGPDDLDRIIRHPFAMIASDGEVTRFGVASPHPRSYGTFARVLSEFVRERRLLTLQEAVRKMSALPAARLGITDRGLVKEGMKADLAVFNPARVKDLATFDKPHQYAEGFSRVIVNGSMAFEAGRMTDARSGRVLRKR